MPPKKIFLIENDSSEERHFYTWIVMAHTTTEAQIAVLKDADGFREAMEDDDDMEDIFGSGTEAEKDKAARKIMKSAKYKDEVGCAELLSKADMVKLRAGKVIDGPGNGF